MSKEKHLHNNGWCTETKLTDPSLAKAMDEYAEEVAVDIIEWLGCGVYAKAWAEKIVDEYKQEKLCNHLPKI